MEIEVTRINKHQGKNGFLGFATVKFTEGDASMTINGFTIGETKSGKLMGRPPQQKNERDGKYYDVVSLHGDFMWTVSNAIVEAYENSNSSSVRPKDDEDTDPRRSAAQSKVEMAKRDGVKETISRVGKRFDPWGEEA